MKSIGSALGGGCGSGVIVFAHHVAVQHGGGCFVEQVTDSGGAAFYASAWVSSEGGELTPPFASANHPPNRISPAYTRRGRYKLPQSHERQAGSQVRMNVGGETIFFAGLGGCREGEGMWASK